MNQESFPIVPRETPLLVDIARQLDSMAERLLAKVPPGHVDYISKAGAAEWAQTLAKELRAIAGKCDNAVSRGTNRNHSR